MANYDYDLGIIGGGAAGLTAAAGAARLGAKVLLVEKEKSLGGDCLHYGCVPSKTLIHVSRVWRQTRRLGRLGLPALDLPAVEFSRVADRIREVIATIQKHDSYERFCGLGVRVAFGDATFADEHALSLVTPDRSERCTARSWLVATGSSAALPDFQGLTSTPFLTNRELFSLPELPASLIVLGGGPIAVEMAQAFQRLGSAVTVVQRSGQILRREDKDLADRVQLQLEDEGVAFRLGCRVLRVGDTGATREVFVADATGAEVALSAAAILVATGRAPNVAGLGLENAGVVYAAAGIPTDRRMRTNQKHIYAAGDVTGQYQFTHAAGYEAGVVLANAIFRLPRKVDYTYMPWCTYVSPELASLGLNEKAAKKLGVDYDLHVESFEDNDRALTEDEPSGLLKLLLDKKGKGLGVQILGPRAGDLLAEWIAAFHGKVGLATLASAVHPYPTLAEINKRVAGAVVGKKIFSDKVKKVLKTLFDLKGRACGI